MTTWDKILPAACPVFARRVPSSKMLCSLTLTASSSFSWTSLLTVKGNKSIEGINEVRIVLRKIIDSRPLFWNHFWGWQYTSLDLCQCSFKKHIKTYTNINTLSLLGKIFFSDKKPNIDNNHTLNRKSSNIRSIHVWLFTTSTQLPKIR